MDRIAISSRNIAVNGQGTAGGPRTWGRRAESQCLGVLLAFGLCGPSLAATLTVNSSADSGGTCPGASCTLRGAIAAASNGDTINFSVATITLTSAELLINKSLAINGGSGVTITRQAGAPAFRILHIAAGTDVALSNLTISNGSGTGTDVNAGSGIRNSGGILTLSNLQVRDNLCVGVDTIGCGIYNAPTGELTLLNSTVSGNSTSGTGSNRGAGIFNVGGQVTLVSSTLSGNRMNTSGTNAGAGLFNDPGGQVQIFDSDIRGNLCAASQAQGCGFYNLGTITMRRSNVSANLATASGQNVGGGVFNSSNALLVADNSTFSGNEVRLGGAGNLGGAIFNNGGGTVAFTNCTLTLNNAASGGGVQTAGWLIAGNTIFAGNSAASGPDVVGTLQSAGYNLLGDSSLTTVGGVATGNVSNVSAMLSALGSWGGGLNTHALLPGSPAINAGATPSEIQQVTVNGSAGSFTLNYNGQTTTPLAFNASATDVQTALRALSNIGDNDIVVTSAGTYAVFFTGALAGADRPQITAAGTGGATVSVRTLWNGGVLASDQRGIARPQQTTPDIGAFESRGFTLAVTSGNNQSTPTNQPFGTLIAVSVTATGGEPVQGGRVTFTPLASGPSCTLSSNPTTISAGLAAPGIVTANNTVGGPYQLAATTRGANTVNLNLINLSTGPITVTSGSDAGGTCPGSACTLRAAIAAITAGETILFAVPTVTLTSAELLVSKNLSIDGGSGVTVTRAEGSPNFRIFNVAAGTSVSMRDLTISNGRSTDNSGGAGGGIRNSGTLTLADTTISNNQCVGSDGSGCGVRNHGGAVLTSTSSSVVNNFSAASNSVVGIGISNGGQLFLDNTRVSDNTMTAGGAVFGAGIYNSSGSVEVVDGLISNHLCTGTQAIGCGIYSNGNLLIRRSTVFGNRARSDGANFGGGIFNETGGTLALENSTISGNEAAQVAFSAPYGGAGVYNDAGATATLVASTVSANASIVRNSIGRAGGVYAEGTLVTSNSLIDGNSSGFGAPDIGGSLISAGHNIFGNDILVTVSGIGTGNQFIVQELVSALGAWGGPQSTHALLPGSPAINAGATPSEIQQLAVSGTAGTFTLSFNGQTTAPLAFDASAGAVQAALEGLSSIGSGNVVVVSGATHLVMFTGARAGTNLAEITSAGAGGASVTQRTLWNGGALAGDQRGIARPQQGIADIGAFESRGFSLAVTSGDNQVTNVNDPFVLPLSLSVASTGDEPVNGGRISYTAPSSGSSASVSPNPVTISGGTATPASVTANGTVGGPYLVAATARGANTVNFSLSNRAAPVLSISDASISEGNSGSQLLSFTITQQGESAYPISVGFATANDTATVADSDYVAASGTATIPVTGATGSTTVNVTVNGDVGLELDERFFVNLSAPQHAVIGDAQAIGTIINDDSQSTTTSLSTTPAPSYVGQSYTVSVSVSGSQISPTGTVSVSDGSSSCGPLNLVPATAPASTASCTFVGTAAGARTLTATYTPDSSISQGSSGSVGHTVSLIETSLSLAGPSRVRMNVIASYVANLGVNPGGLPAPTGTLTLTAASSSCTATLPDTACNLVIPPVPGPVTVSASYSGDSRHAPSTSSGAGNLGVVIYALADVSVSKSNGQSTYLPDDLLVYNVIVGNAGPDPAHALRVVDLPPAGLSNISWSCNAAAGAGCPVPNGTGVLDLILGPIPVGGSLTFTYTGTVDGSPDQISNTAELILPSDTTLEDSNQVNNRATDTDHLESLFRDGFEAPLVKSAMGIAPLPLTALAQSNDGNARLALSVTDVHGEALRVYVRGHGQALQLARAQRDARGLLQLGPWQAWQGESHLYWTGAARGGGWALDSGHLR